MSANDQVESPTLLTRKRSMVEREVWKHHDAANAIVQFLPPENFLPHVPLYLPPMLQGSIFCGHLVTDLDSIAGSIGAAELYGGIPARASDINSETMFALKYWNVNMPEPIEEILVKLPTTGVCLVDHQQTSQLNKAIDITRIVGVIDHHALQNSTIVTDMPIYIDIRPWGSMSTIIAHTFMVMKIRPTKPTAGLLLCAILSDTLNLQGPTTTEWDRLMAATLAMIGGVEDVQLLASQQFKAKSAELAGLSAHMLCTGDQKVFTFNTPNFNGSLGFAVIETIDDDVIMVRKEELLQSLQECKESRGLSLLYLAVVNIVQLRSHLLICGDVERSLAHAAFSDKEFVQPADPFEEPCVMYLGSLVSRKKDFVPAVTRAIVGGWTAELKRSIIKRSSSDVFDLSMM